jgi:ribosomal silencing factor RsfS
VAGGSAYDVVVIASGSNAQTMELLARRLRAKLPDSAVEHIGIDGVIGVRGARRGSKKE